MFFGSTVGKRLEPVSNVCNAVLKGPCLHTCGNAVGSLAIQMSTVVDAVNQSIESLGIKILVHLVTVEYQLSEIVGNLSCRCLHSSCLLLESILHHIKSKFTHSFMFLVFLFVCVQNDAKLSIITTFCTQNVNYILKLILKICLNQNNVTLRTYL